MTVQRPLAAVYEAQPVIEAMVLAFKRDNLDAAVLSVTEVRDILERHFAARPSVLAISEAFDEGSRLGVWTLIGKMGQPNHIEVNRSVIGLLAQALSSQSDSVFCALDKVGGNQLNVELVRARRESEEDLKRFPSLETLQAPLKRLEHNQVFQRGLAATRSTDKLVPFSPTSSHKSGIDWTKSSAIAAWIAIPLGAVAAIAAIVALWK